MPAHDGLNVFARSLASAKPIAGVELTLVAKNNEILGTAKTDDDGRATFTAGSTRGDGGMVPAAIMAKGAGDDFVFLDMTRAGFDLTDRGVEGRAAPGALDVYAYTERGIYRAGETVHVAALARDAAASAVEHLPLTFIFSRPDGVEDRRLSSDGAALGGHAVDAVARRQRHARHLAGRRSTPIPRSPPIARRDVPGRGFRSRSHRIRPDQRQGRDRPRRGGGRSPSTAASSTAHRPPGSTLEGEITLSTMTEWDRFPNYQFGLADEEEGDDTQIPLDDLPRSRRRRQGDLPRPLDQLPSTTRCSTPRSRCACAKAAAAPSSASSTSRSARRGR